MTYRIISKFMRPCVRSLRSPRAITTFRRRVCVCVGRPGAVVQVSDRNDPRVRSRRSNELCINGDDGRGYRVYAVRMYVGGCVDYPPSVNGRQCLFQSQCVPPPPSVPPSRPPAAAAAALGTLIVDEKNDLGIGLTVLRASRIPTDSIWIR